MGLIARFFAWLSGKPNFTITKRVILNNVELEKIYVFAKGREATLQEASMVIGHPHFKVDYQGEGSGLRFATETWSLLPGEDEAGVLPRLARETAAKHPGLSVVAFAWPHRQPTVFVAIVTEGEFKCPFAEAQQCTAPGVKPAENE
jgi:hypothetical protein